MFNLENKKIVLTGAGGGLGSVLLSRLHDAGAKVFGCDRDAAAIDTQKTAHVSEFDLLDPEQVARGAEKLLGFGAPDCVIANAGYTRAELMATLTPDELDAEIRVNLIATMQLTSLLLPAMRPTGGNFVFISSVNAAQHFGNPAYAAAKAGVEAWMRALATEEGPNRIRANAVAPGSIQTPAWDHRLEQNADIVRTISAHYPMNRFVTPEEVAEVVLFLASDRASGVTGAVIPVDAGLRAGNPPFIANLNA